MTNCKHENFITFEGANDTYVHWCPECGGAQPGSRQEVGSWFRPGPNMLHVVKEVREEGACRHVVGRAIRETGQKIAAEVGKTISAEVEKELEKKKPALRLIPEEPTKGENEAG